MDGNAIRDVALRKKTDKCRFWKASLHEAAGVSEKCVRCFHGKAVRRPYVFSPVKNQMSKLIVSFVGLLNVMKD